MKRNQLQQAGCAGQGLLIALKEFDGGGRLGHYLLTACHGKMGSCLARHSILAKMFFEHRFKGAVETPIPFWIIGVARQYQSLLAEVFQCLLHMFHSLPHHVLELNVPKGI